MNRAIRLADVVNFFEYEKVREERRRRVIALKEKRRVTVGPYLSFVFENRETLLFQIKEMCRAERIIDDAKVQEEIDVYRALLPEPGELSATLFIEISDKDQIKPVLDRFMGIDTGRHVWLEMGRGMMASGEFEAATPTRRRASSPPSTSCASPSPRRRCARSARPTPTWWRTIRPTGRAPACPTRQRPNS